MQNDEIVKMIPILIVLLGSLAVYTWGRRTKRMNLVIIGVMAFLFGIFVLFYEFPKYQETFSAWTAVIVAFTAVIAISENIIDRKENKDRENRENTKRLLKEIRDWSKEAADTAIMRQTRDYHELWQTKLKYKSVITESAYIKRVVESSFKDLLPFIKDIVLKLEQLLDLTSSVIDKKDDGTNLTEYERLLAEAVEKLLNELGSSKYTFTSQLLNNEVNSIEAKSKVGSFSMDTKWSFGNIIKNRTLVGHLWSQALAMVATIIALFIFIFYLIDSDMNAVSTVMGSLAIQLPFGIFLLYCLLVAALLVNRLSRQMSKWNKVKCLSVNIVGIVLIFILIVLVPQFKMGIITGKIVGWILVILLIFYNIGFPIAKQKQ